MRNRTVRVFVTILSALFSASAFMQLKYHNFYHRHFSFRFGHHFVKMHESSASPLTLSFPSSHSPNLVVAIVTVYRPGLHRQYFHTTLRSLSDEFQRSNASYGVRVIACESGRSDHPDYLKPLRQSMGIYARPPPYEDDVTAKECQDYVFTLRKALESASTAQHILVLEDDAPLRQSGSPFFPTLRSVISQAERNGRRFAYLKLYHPPRLLGFFQPEWDRHLEALAIVALVGSAILLASHSGRGGRILLAMVRHCRLTVFCLILAVYMLDRHWILELRALSVGTHVLTPATFCCTQGMLFQRKAAVEVAEFMKRANCSKDNKKDKVLFDFYQRSGMASWYVQPNLLGHVGVKSTLHHGDVGKLNL